MSKSRKEDNEDRETTPDVVDEGFTGHCHGGQRYKGGSIEGECKDRLVQEFKEVGR